MDHEALVNLFISHLIERSAPVRNGTRLVHYTNADTALKIINGKQVWLRNAHLMNDYSEMRHGLQCLQAAWASDAGTRLRDWLEQTWPGLRDEVENTFNDHVSGMTDHTYILSLSEHDDSEDLYGRLSMWRAYGGRAGIALVLNPDVFLSETDAMAVYSTPVIYMDETQFVAWFDGWANRLIGAEDEIKAVERQEILNLLFFAFRTFVLATKHPGFCEEREWRVFHSPLLDGSSDWVHQEVESLGGVPQHVMKVDLKDDPVLGVQGASPEVLLNRVIIGPCETPLPIRETLLEALQNAGVPDPSAKVVMSHIPVRERQ